jgi:hypothetical protein
MSSLIPAILIASVPEMDHASRGIKDASPYIAEEFPRPRVDMTEQRSREPICLTITSIAIHAMRHSIITAAENVAIIKPVLIQNLSSSHPGEAAVTVLCRFR